MSDRDVTVENRHSGRRWQGKVRGDGHLEIIPHNRDNPVRDVGRVSGGDPDWRVVPEKDRK